MATAVYLATMSASLARRNGYHALGYLLDMASLKATTIHKNAGDPGKRYAVND